MNRPAKWGLVATIKAPARDILNFAAWHLEQGATKLFIYLDDDLDDAATDTRDALNAHPQITAQLTDDAYWATHGNRPRKHQVRQTRNASHAYRQANGVDWLAHIDVDEFLMPVDRSISTQLSELPETTDIARARPVEALAPSDGDTGDVVWFKAMKHNPKERQIAAEHCFPTWGPYLSGGFLSHVAGKIFVRTGLDDIEIRIHNAFRSGDMLRNEAELVETELCHMHAASWDHWSETLAFRLERGSYRSELKPPVRGSAEAVNLNTLLGYIIAEQGTAGLRAFYQEVCVAHPDLRARLETFDLLRCYDLTLDCLRTKHFSADVDELFPN